MSAEPSNSDRPEKQPQHISEFRQLEESTDHYAIPEIPEKRKFTDFRFVVVFGTCLLFYLPFLIYTSSYSDLNRVKPGYDMCGNVCGRPNSHVYGIACSGRDKTNYSFLRFRETPSRSFGIYQDYHIGPGNTYDCVKSCDRYKYIILINKCYPVTELRHVLREAAIKYIFLDNHYAVYMVGICLTAFALSLGMFFLFRYFVAVAVWGTLISLVTGVVLLTGFFWYMCKADRWDISLRNVSIFVTVLSVILICLLKFMAKRINLVIRLLKEAIKIISGVPLIVLVPLLTLLAHVTLIFIMMFFWALFSTAGRLMPVTSDIHLYLADDVMVFTSIIHAITGFWIYKFITGCQRMVISGAVSAYYFTKDKTTLNSSIYNSLYNLIRYHLGTVAFGSLILPIVSIVNLIIFCLCCLVSSFTARIKHFPKYMSKNAYIQTAMHGRPFVKSGQRAARLLTAYRSSSNIANCVRNFVLFTAKLWIIICNCIIATLFARVFGNHAFKDLQITFLILTAVIADCFLKVFEIAIDTMFLCFCEDSCKNDGVERPYYMTTEFMQYVEEAKEAIKEKCRP